MGFPDSPVHQGSRAGLLKLHKLDYESVAREILKFIKR
jgi:hypothetical protein